MGPCKALPSCHRPSLLNVSLSFSHRRTTWCVQLPSVLPVAPAEPWHLSYSTRHCRVCNTTQHRCASISSTVSMGLGSAWPTGVPGAEDGPTRGNMPWLSSCPCGPAGLEVPVGGHGAPSALSATQIREGSRPSVLLVSESPTASAPRTALHSVAVTADPRAESRASPGKSSLAHSTGWHAPRSPALRAGPRWDTSFQGSLCPLSLRLCWQQLGSLASAHPPGCARPGLQAPHCLRRLEASPSRLCSQATL